jgi:UDP-N-acetylmuramoylalanine--D-glutamate ligase
MWAAYSGERNGSVAQGAAAAYQVGHRAEEQVMTELDRVKSALVIGLGISGKAAAEKLLDLGKQVTVNDISTSQEVSRSAASLAELGADIALGHHQSDLLHDRDLVVVSPGVPARLPLLRQAADRGIAVWSEIELAWRLVRGPVVAVTGTNGKTTTVRMIEWIFNQAGYKARAAGNIGFPFIKAVDEAEVGELLVLEISSFQLVHTQEFHPATAVLLNIAEDHFDWHEHMQEYVEAKSRIWMNQDQEDLVVCNLDDPLCVLAAGKAPSRIMYFSHRPDPLATTYMSEGRMVSRSRLREEMALELSEITGADSLALPGEHNLENAMAAATVAIARGIDAAEAGKALRDFPSLPHRLQLVGEVEGVRFYNDSKATNPHAAMRALSAFPGPLVVILGGKNKGLSFDDLAAALEEKDREGKIRALFLVGDAAEEISATLQRVTPHMHFDLLPGLEEVFEALPQVTKPGDVVLLSPACASFDRYGDYQERGEHFQKMVEDYHRGRDGC